LSAPCDIANVEDVERVTRAVLARFGKIDVLINNAGVGYPGGFLDLPLKYWNEMLEVNLNGVVHLTRFALPSLVETHGAIVNVASIAACGGERGNSIYAAGKAAVNSLTKSLALEFGHVVRVNCVNPGLTRSELTEILFDPKSAYYSIGQKLIDVIPRKAPARPDEIANAIVFLASDEASFINGACAPVDGGVSASNGQGAFLDAQSRWGRVLRAIGAICVGSQRPAVRTLMGVTLVDASPCCGSAEKSENRRFVRTGRHPIARRRLCSRR
jgi:meso-butanediol dehydrogenase / (S,S)-butanediol dehydrogenase / diacetyl reductase